MPVNTHRPDGGVLLEVLLFFDRFHHHCVLFIGGKARDFSNFQAQGRDPHAWCARHAISDALARTTAFAEAHLR